MQIQEVMMPLTRKYSPRKSAHPFTLAIFMIAVILVQSSVLAKDGRSSGMLPGLGKTVPIGAVPHTIGNLWCNLTNYGWLGDANMETPSMEWPGGTGNMYLYQGSLWVAGVNATGSHCTAGDENEWYPTLAQSKIDAFSTANGVAFTTDDYVIVLASSNLSSNIDADYVLWYDSDLYGVKGFDDDGDGLIDEDPLDYIDNDGDGLINEDFAAVSEEDTYTMYNDLWLEHHASGDEGLGLEVIERTYAWSYSYAQDFFILDYEVINVGRSSNKDSENMLEIEPDLPGPIDDLYLAIRYDFDISNRASGEYWYDDLTEYLASDKLSYGYDGDDPDVIGNDKGENGLSPGYLGIRTLDTSIPDLDGNKGIPSSHNWWTIDDDPSSDALKFQYMSNGVYAAVPPSPYDYRYLHTVGPFDLAAGDTVRWYAATGIGLGLGGRDNPDPHNEKGSLRDVMAFAQELYDAGWLAATPPPAPVMEYTVQADGSILLDWSGSQSLVEDYVDPLSGVVDFEGYRVYKSDRSDASGAILWLPLATYDIPGDGVGAESGLQYTYVDKDVNKGFAYNYAVTAFDDGLTPIGVLESSKGAAVSSARIEYNAPPADNLDNIAVVPNPYLGSEIWDHRPSFQEQWWSKLQFINLPEEECTVRIYTLTGDFVIEITKAAGPSFVNWDLISENDADIVSGVYLFVVEDDNDSAVGKFVVIR